MIGRARGVPRHATKQLLPLGIGPSAFGLSTVRVSRAEGEQIIWGSDKGLEIHHGELAGDLCATGLLLDLLERADSMNVLLNGHMGYIESILVFPVSTYGTDLRL